MNIFANWPKKVIFENGAASHLAEIIRDMQKSRVMFVTDDGLKSFPWVTEIYENLKKAGLESEFYGGVGPNPSTEMVHELVDLMRGFEPDIVVALGGGSAIDTCKAARPVYTYGGSVTEYKAFEPATEKFDDSMPPLVAIPTTAGTGSEVTAISVITDLEAKFKFGMNHPLLMPDFVILDPALTVTLPKATTAFTGMDVLTHCVEAYISNVDFPPSDAFALEGIRLVAQNLERAVADGSDVEARANMLMASFLGGAAFTQSWLGVCHAAAHQLSALYNTPHGLANAILLSESMKYNLPCCKKKYAHIAAAMGGDIKELSEDGAAELAISLVEKLAKSVGVPEYLEDIGASKEDLDVLVEKAMMDGCHYTNPQPVESDDVKNIFLAKFKD